MPDMPEVVPAILTNSREELKDMLGRAAHFATRIQIDIADGRFVPSRSVGLEEVKGLKIDVPWEVHLMVEEPQEYLGLAAMLGAQEVIFHYEAARLPDKVIGEGHRLGLAVGMALNPQTPIEVAEPFLDHIEGLLFLSVHPGFYGSPFIPAVLDKIHRFHKLQPQVVLGIDGGVKEDNIGRAVEAGASRICIGSAIFGSKDPEASYYRLVEKARAAFLSLPS